MMPTVEEALLYLSIDYADEVVIANVKRALASAMQTLKGSVGDDVEELLPGDPRVTELVLLYLDDLYSNRGLSYKQIGSQRRLISDMEWQLRLELRQLRKVVEE